MNPKISITQNPFVAKSCRSCLRLLMALAILCWGSLARAQQSETWMGTNAISVAVTNAFTWTNNLNWVDNTTGTHEKPTALGDNMTFGGSTTVFPLAAGFAPQNNFTVNLITNFGVGSITFRTNGFILGGSAIQITNGITDNVGANSNAIPMVIGKAQTFQNLANSATVNGLIYTNIWTNTVSGGVDLMTNVLTIGGNGPVFLTSIVSSTNGGQFIVNNGSICRLAVTNMFGTNLVQITNLFTGNGTYTATTNIYTNVFAIVGAGGYTNYFTFTNIVSSTNGTTAYFTNTYAQVVDALKVQGGIAQVNSLVVGANGGTMLLPNGTNVGNISVDGTLDLNGMNPTINGLEDSGGYSGKVDNLNPANTGIYTLTVGNANSNAVFNGVIQNTAGSVALTKIGWGTQTLAGSSTYSGATTINQGTLLVAAGGGLGEYSQNLTIASGAMLDVSQWNDYGGYIPALGYLTLAAGTPTKPYTNYLGSYDPYWPTYTVSISGTNNVFTYQTNVVAGVTNVYTTTNFVSLAYSTNSIISVVTADVNGDFIVNGGGAISPITSVAPGLATWTINGDLTLDNSKLISAPNNLNRVNFLLNTTTTPGGGTNDLIAVSGTLYIGDELDVVVTPLTGTLANGKYTLFTCGTAYVPYGNSAIDSDSDPANLVLIAPRGIVGPAGDPTHPFSSDLHNVYLTVSGTASPGSLIWQGTPALNNWNVHLSQNWKTNGTYTPAAQYFYSLDNVIFDDTGVGTVVLPTVVNPSSLAFNNSLTNYTFTQNASTFITGTSGLVKNGSGTVTLQNPNSFTGDITVNNGTLACGYYSGAGGVQKTLYNGVPAGNLILSGGTINLNETQINSTPEADFQNVTINPGASAMTQSGRTAGSTPIYVISNNMTRAVGGTLNLVMQTSPTIGYGTDNGGHCGIFFANTNAQGYYGVNRILGGYATFALSDWVVANNTNTGSHALGEYQTGTTPGLWASTDNVSVSSAISGIGTQTINSLKLNPNSAYAVSINPSQTLTLSSGGLLIPNATTPYQIILTGGTLQGPKNADVIVLNNNITVGSSLRIDTPIQDNTDPGPCALTLSGGGTTILTGNNTYTGPTYINNGISGATPGTLQIGANGTSGSIAYSSAIIDNGTLAFSRSDNTSAGAISGTGSLQKLGGGVLTLTANNSLSGSVTISAGTLQLGTGGAVGSVSNTTAIVDNGTLVFDNNNTVSYSKPISGYGGLVQFGSGNLIIATNEAYSGATTVSNGTMTLTASGSIPNTTAITVNAGALLDVSAVSGGLVLRSTAPAEVLSGSGTINGSVTTASGTTVSPGNSSGAIGTLTINNDLALSGGSFLFDVGNASSDRINSATLHENSGTVVINVTGGTLNNGVYKLVHTTSASITGSASSLGLFGFNQPGQIGVLTNEASGDLSLLVYSGTITTLTWVGGVSANAWDIAGSANWTTGSGTTTYANPDYVVINDSGANTPAISMNAALSPTTLTLNNNTEAYTLGVSGNTGKITGGASLIVNGTAGVTLLTKNDYLGGTTIAAGPVTLGDNASASNDGMVGGSGSIVNNGTLVANDYGTETINGAISGSGQLVQRGAGTLILAGNNSAYSGGISNSTTLQMGNGYTGTLGTGIITNNSSVVFNVGPTPASIVAVNANITGTGGITNLGPGIVTLNGSNTYSGKTTIDNGTVRLGSDNAILGTSGIFMDTAISPAAVGTLDLNGHNITVPTLQGANTGSANANIVVGKILNNGTGVATLTIGGGATMTNNAELLDNNNGGTGQLALLVTNNSYVYLYSDWNNLQTTIYPNLFSGGIIISNASVVLGFNAGNNLTPGNEGTAAAGTGPITLLGGHGLVIDGRTGAPTNGMLFACNNGGSSSPTVNTTVGTINVPTGEYGTIFGSMRGTLAGSLAGGGTVTLSTEYVRGHFNLADAGFNGTVILAGLNVGGGAGGNYGIESSAGWGGWPNAAVFCHTNNLSTIDVCSTSTGFVQFGSLSGGDNTCLFDGAPGPSGFGGINTIYAIGSLGTSAPGVSTTNGSQFIAGVGIRKVGYGSLTLTNNVLSYGGETVVSNGTLAFIPLGNNPGAFNPLTNNYLVGSNYTIVSPGILDVSQAGNTLYLGRCTNSAYTQTLFGNGTLNGNLVTMVSSNSIVAPGYRADNPNIYSGGQLTVSGTATFNSGSTVIISINSTSGVGGTFTNDSVNALGGLTVNQTRLTIVNTGGAFAPSSTNVIYAFWDPNTPVPVPFGSSGVTNLTLPALAAGEYWVTNLSGGNLVSLAVVDTNAALNASAPPLQVAVSGNTLKLGWPTNRGWILQAQTNVSSIGLSNNWVDVPGSALITNTVITVDSNQPAVFYRMRNPSAPVR